MNDAQLHRLERLFGGSFATGRGIPERFCYDESTVHRAVPEALFTPATEEEIAAFIAVAGEERIPVVPRGLGTGVCGGCVALFGGVVLSLERMTRIVDLDERNMCVRVEPGITNGVLKNFLCEAGYYYPPDPQSYETSSIGGNIATNAGGPRAIRYGTTKNYVMSLRVVTGDAGVLETGGKTYKFSSGYNLNELFCGSEGTFGIVTAATLRVLPPAPERLLYFIPFRDIGGACAFLNRTGASHLVFSACEFIDDTAKVYVEHFLGRMLPSSGDARCYVFAEVEGTAGDEGELLGRLAEESGGIDVFSARDKGQEERLWEARREVSSSFKASAKRIYKADVVVPRGAIAPFISELKSLATDRIPIACFGHVGDGNVHVNLLDTDGTGADTALVAMGEVMGMVRRFGGFPSGEHGIGVSKLAYIDLFFSRYHQDVWRRIKGIFDPRGIMNPGKVLP